MRSRKNRARKERKKGTRLTSPTRTRPSEQPGYLSRRELHEILELLDRQLEVAGKELEEGRTDERRPCKCENE